MSSWVAWECDRCLASVKINDRSCWKCDYTVFKPLTQEQLDIENSKGAS